MKSLERRLSVAYLTLAVFVSVQLGMYFWPSAQVHANSEAISSEAKVIRTRGIVIVDDQGRERILLGAPIPSAKNRVRTDLARVKEIWGKRFPDSYLDYYKNYNHNVNGMLVLDENGFDRLAVGDQTPDPNIGKRVGPQTGMIWNDEEGFERGGLGILKVKGRYRVALGMDSEKSGSEGLTLSLIDGGQMGMGIFDSKSNSTFVGFLPPNTFNNDTTDPFNGILMKQGKEVKYRLSTFEKK